jgi:hypothetical protein
MAGTGLPRTRCISKLLSILKCLQREQRNLKEAVETAPRIHVSRMLEGHALLGEAIRCLSEIAQAR